MQTITAAQTAALIRKDLRAQWPAVRFSVRSSNHAGGSRVLIVWTDGPTAEDVQRLVNRYGGATFDAMTDCKGYAHPADDLPRSYSWLDCDRRYSRDAFAGAVKDLCARYGLPMPTLTDDIGGCYIAADVWLEPLGRYLGQAANHALQSITL